MPKRLRFFLASTVLALVFGLLIGVTYEVRYYVLALGVVLAIISNWLALGIVFEHNLLIRLAAALPPVLSLAGMGLFVALLPLNYIGILGLSILFGFLNYAILLVENIFMVAIGYKTVPLYRAAYTVSLIILLLGCFFAFDTILSFRSIYWVNMLAVGLVAFLVFLYQFWAIAIELPDDGKDKSALNYSLIPAMLVGELALVFSFWPVGVFKGSIYLVCAIYILSGLIQADIRDRLFKRTWIGFVYVAVAVLVSIVTLTSWGRR
jgi:hypothetical protein